MIANHQRRIRVPIKPLAQFCEVARQAMGFPEESVSIRLVSDPVIARLNRKYRGKAGPTDVLSFPAQMPVQHRRYRRNRGDHAGPYIGDIAISPQTAQRYARRGARSLSAELRILILHGMIHLAGYDHETDHGEMDRFERRMRRRLKLQ